MNHLPSDCWLEIVSFLTDREAQQQVAVVSSRWRSLSKRWSRWKRAENSRVLLYRFLSQTKSSVGLANWLSTWPERGLFYRYLHQTSHQSGSGLRAGTALEAIFKMESHIRLKGGLQEQPLDLHQQFVVSLAAVLSCSPDKKLTTLFFESYHFTPKREIEETAAKLVTSPGGDLVSLAELCLLHLDMPGLQSGVEGHLGFFLETYPASCGVENYRVLVLASVSWELQRLFLAETPLWTWLQAPQLQKAVERFLEAHLLMRLRNQL